MRRNGIAVSPNETAGTGPVGAWFVVLPLEKRRLDERSIGEQMETGEEEADEGLAQCWIIGTFEWHKTLGAPRRPCADACACAQAGLPV